MGQTSVFVGGFGELLDRLCCRLRLPRGSPYLTASLSRSLALSHPRSLAPPTAVGSFASEGAASLPERHSLPCFLALALSHSLALFPIVGSEPRAHRHCKEGTREGTPPQTRVQIARQRADCARQGESADREARRGWQGHLGWRALESQERERLEDVGALANRFLPRGVCLQCSSLSCASHVSATELLERASRVDPHV